MSNSRLLAAMAVLTVVPVVGLAVSSPAMTQPAPEQQYIGQIVDQGRYLDGFLGLERTAGQAGSDRNSVDLARSLVLGSTSDYVPPNTQDRCPDQSVSEAIRDAQPINALSEIVRRARTAQIVILNENHLEPRHRAFALQVARALRPLGYRYLAMEALSNQLTDDRSAEDMAELARRRYGHCQTNLARAGKGC